MALVYVIHEQESATGISRFSWETDRLRLRKYQSAHPLHSTPSYTCSESFQMSLPLCLHGHFLLYPKDYAQLLTLTDPSHLLRLPLTHIVTMFPLLSLSLIFFFQFSFLFVLWPHGMACGSLVYCPRIELSSSALEVQSLNPWTIREVPPLLSWHPLLPLIFPSSQAESWKTWIRFRTLLFETLHWLCFVQVQRARTPPQIPRLFPPPSHQATCLVSEILPIQVLLPFPPILPLDPLEPSVRVPFSVRTNLNWVLPNHLPQSPTLYFRSSA